MNKVQKKAFLELLGQVFKEKNITGLSKTEMDKAMSDYLVAHPIEGKTDEEVNALIGAYVTAHNLEHLTTAQVATMVSDYWTAHPDEDRTDAEVTALVETYVTNNPDKFTSKAELEAYTPAGGGGSSVVVNPRAITVKEGYSEAQLRALVAQMTADHIATIPQSQKAVGSVVYKWNETRPAIVTPNIVSLNQEKNVGGVKALGMSYASKKDWLLVMDDSNHNMRVLKGSDLSVVMNIDTNSFGTDSLMQNVTTTPDVKRVAISQIEHGFVRILKLKDDLSGYELESSIDTGGGFSVGDLALDGIGATLVFTTFNNKEFKIYDLDNQGSWNHIKTYPIGLKCRGVEISKDGLEIYAVAQDNNVRSAVKVNGVWGEISNIAVLPNGSSDTDNKYLSLSLDKQVLYVADAGYDNNKGRVSVFYKQSQLDPFNDGSLKYFNDFEDSLEAKIGSTITMKTGVASYESVADSKGLIFASNEAINIPFGSTLQGNNFTLSMRVNIKANVTNEEYGTGIYSKDWTANKGAFNLGFSVGMYKDYPQHKVVSLGTNHSGANDTTYGSELPLGVHTLTCVSNTEGVNLYVDGVLFLSRLVPITDKMEDLFMGRWGGSIVLDDLKLFNRALTQNEVTKLFKNNGLAWQHKYDINPANPVANNYFGIGVALNEDNSVAFIGEYESHKVYKYDIAVASLTLDANSLDPFGDGSLKYFHKLDGDAVDSVGGANGTVRNGSYEALKYDKGYIGNGNNSQILVPANNDFDITKIGTISFWAKIVDISKANILSIGGNSDDYDSLGVNFSEGKPHFYLTNQGTHTPFKNVTSSITCATNTLYHVVVTTPLSNESDEYSIYINGQLDGNLQISTDANGTPATAKGIMCIGSYARDVTISSTIYSSSNKIDHLQIFNRALTQEEVTKLYEAEVK